MRNEIKFKFYQRDLLKVKEQLIKSSFNWIYPKRLINNIYFDTSSKNSLNDNIEGLKYRTKYRARWYGEFGLEDQKEICLECKIKNNSLGWKKTIKIVFNDDLKLKEKLSAISNKIKIYESKRYMPVIINQYSREYLENPNGTRITIDSNIKYFNYLNIKTVNDPNLILEVKFGVNHYFNFDFLKNLNLIASKNSKFVNGIEAFL